MSNIIKWIPIFQPRGKFEIYEDITNKESRWHIISSNGTVIGASSEWFHSESYCEENAKLVMQGIAEYLKNSKSSPKSGILSPKKIINPLSGLLLKKVSQKIIPKPILIPAFSKLSKNG